MKRLAIFGAGGHGKVLADIAHASGWRNISFYDDVCVEKANGPWPVIGNFETLLSKLGDYEGVIVALGNAELRWSKQDSLEKAGAAVIILIHPFSSVSQYTSLGPGTVVMPGAIINAGVKVGKASIINTGATVDHDCEIGHASHICPGAHLSGSVKIGSFSWVGIGSSICQGVRIGSGVVLGAGTVVIKDVEDGLKMVGKPARLVSKD
jgi:sugar O-acyltransferase (sialic acid O-acetyltransferase NeuD family)